MKKVLQAMESVYEERLCEVRRELMQYNARNETDESMGDFC